MAMKSDYLFSKSCCSVFLHKYEQVQLGDGTQSSSKRESEMVPKNTINKSPLNNYQNGPSGPISGKLWRNQYHYYCCKIPCACGTITHSIQGFRTTLSEIRSNCCPLLSRVCFIDLKSQLLFNPVYCCCKRNYLIDDGYGKSLGQMTYSCCQMRCCVHVTVANRTNPEAYTIRPKCCYPWCWCCGDKWFITDRQNTQIATITKQCCTCYPHIAYNFHAELSNEDKILLMSSIPHLP